MWKFSRIDKNYEFFHSSASACFLIELHDHSCIKNPASVCPCVRQKYFSLLFIICHHKTASNTSVKNVRTKLYWGKSDGRNLYYLESLLVAAIMHFLNYGQ